MPTIQLKISDDEFQHLCELSGENTGIKAVRFIINDYQKVTSLYRQLLISNQNTIRDLNNIDDAVTSFVSAFDRLTDIAFPTAKDQKELTK